MEEAGGPDRFEAHARVWVGGQLLEQVQGVRHAIAPVAQHACGGGAGAEIRRAEHFVQQVDVDDVVVLVDPQGLQQVVLVVGIVLVEVGDPSCGAAITCVAVAAAQLDPGPVAHAVLGLLEQVEQLLDRLAGDLDGL